MHPPEGFETYHLRGNHDQALLDFLENPASYRTWRRFGAGETLLSYEVEPPVDDGSAAEIARDELAERMPASHLRFLQQLEGFVQIGSYHFVHAGARPGIALEDQFARRHDVDPRRIPEFE